jgi:hypothetical protein
MLFVLTSLSGCAGNGNAVLKAGQSTRQDVFQEYPESQVTPGKAQLQIEFPVKTFSARIFTTYVKHNDPPYTVIINIDGQSVELTDEPVLEDLAGDIRDNPEAGTGWKYNFRKTLLLEPGKHRVTVAVPLSDVVAEKELLLHAGINLMQIVPEYNTSSSRHPGYSGFDHGLTTVQIKLNNQEK